MDHSAFVAAPKSILIAPAGHGKTHAIAECLLYTNGKQLILTHTHAGIASIKEKIKKANILPNKFHIETITGYAQKYVHAYHTGNDVPSVEDSNNYYPFLIAKATALFKRRIIQKTIATTYAGLFVDEYQDCTSDQHELVTALSAILPTHILGDPLQGIFGFKGVSMVSLTDNEQMADYQKHQQKLEEPWRWKGKNESLGKALQGIRSTIEANQQIDLREYPSIELINISNSNDLYIPTKQYYRGISSLLSEKNVLLIHPLSSSVSVRLRIISGFKNPIALIESIDDKDFYHISKLLDATSKDNIETHLITIFQKLFNKTGIGTWFNDKGLIKKKKDDEQSISRTIEARLTDIKAAYSLKKIASFILYIDSLKNIRCYRKELLKALCNSLVEAEVNKQTVYQSMFEKRNYVRRVGRKVHGRCIGTTLLTKGLEFDTVIVLNAHEFTCPKNLYVALTRASKRLIVCTANPILSPVY